LRHQHKTSFATALSEIQSQRYSIQSCLLNKVKGSNRKRFPPQQLMFHSANTHAENRAGTEQSDSHDPAKRKVCWMCKLQETRKGYACINCRVIEA